MLLYIKILKYKILRTLRNSSNEEPGSLIAAKFGLWFCDWATCVGQHMGYHAQKKQALFSLKLFHFCLHGCWHFWFQSGTFSDDFQVPLSRFSIVSSRSAFIFWAIAGFPELLHTQGLHKFVGSISGVVPMNAACILKMVLEWIHLSRPLCHICRNSETLC